MVSEGFTTCCTQYGEFAGYPGQNLASFESLSNARLPWKGVLEYRSLVQTLRLVVAEEYVR